MARQIIISLCCSIMLMSGAIAAPAGTDAGGAASGAGYSRAVLKAAFSCDGRHLCRQMRSCAEARYFLEVCGVTRLDGDGDGVPCESICGSN